MTTGDEATGPQQALWMGIGCPHLKHRIDYVISDLAEHLAQQDVASIAEVRSKKQTAYPQSVSWRPLSIAQGYSGLAVVFAQLALSRPGEGWGERADRLLRIAAAEAERETTWPAGLFSGLTGVAYAAWYLSVGGRQSAALVANLERLAISAITDMANSVRNQEPGMSVGSFDVISGLAGIGAYLLCRIKDPTVRPTFESVVESLVSLEGSCGGLPRWYTPGKYVGDAATIRLYPHGNLNCGLAHGIPGPLGLLSLAYIYGVRVAGIAKAIEGFSEWLYCNRHDDAWGVNWPSSIPLKPGDKGNASLVPDLSDSGRFGPTRAAWCYGAPGVARALWLAGSALQVRRYRDCAIEAMAAVYRRPVSERKIDSPTFCHGVAGLLQITMRFAADTGLEMFQEASEMLCQQLLDLYRPETLLGYYCLEPNGGMVEKLGLLDGAAGVLITLLAARGGPEPAWDRLFLLS